MVCRTATIRFALALLTALAVLPTQAQIFRAYLSTAGNDANPCTLPAPCRLIPAAINAVASGGEIWILEPGNYNTAEVAIGKPMTIRAMPGIVASFVAPAGQSAFVVNSSTKVGLFGLTFGSIAGAGAGLNGVSAGQFTQVSIEDCTFQGLQGSGVRVEGLQGIARISNSTFLNNGAGVTASSGGQTAITGSRFTGNGFGVSVDAQLFEFTVATITDSVIAAGGVGVAVNASGSGGTSTGSAILRGVTIHGLSSTALASTTQNSLSASDIIVSRSTITRNLSPFAINEAAGSNARVITMGDNVIEYHLGPGVGTLTPGTPR